MTPHVCPKLWNMQLILALGLYKPRQVSSCDCLQAGGKDLQYMRRMFDPQKVSIHCLPDIHKRTSWSYPIGLQYHRYLCFPRVQNGRGSCCLRQGWSQQMGLNSSSKVLQPWKGRSRKIQALHFHVTGKNWQASSSAFLDHTQLQ